MKKLLVLLSLCLAFALPASAGDLEVPAVAAMGMLGIYLTEKPCTNEAVLKRLDASVHKNYRQGYAQHMQFGERAFCYLSLPQYAYIFIIDEVGEQVDLPKAMFKPLTKV